MPKTRIQTLQALQAAPAKAAQAASPAMVAALERVAKAARPDYAAIGRGGSKRRADHGAPRDAVRRAVRPTSWRPGHR